MAVKSAKKKSSNLKASASLSKGKNSKSAVIGVVVFAFCLLLVFEAVNLFKVPEVEKNINAQVVGQFSGSSLPCGRFSAWDVAGWGKEKVAVTDQLNGRILFFDRTGKYLKSWGQKGEGPKDLKEPSGMASDAKGNVYFVDSWKSVIIGLDEKEKPFLNVPLTQGFYGPRGVAYDGSYFYVADTGTHRVVKVSPQGEIISSWGGGTKRGSGKDELDNPRSLKVDAKGNIYVADYENSRVQVLDPTGKYINMIKVGNKASDVALDSRGRLFVASMEGGFVKVYGADGKYLGQLKDDKGSDAPFKNVSGINFTADDLLLLSGQDLVTLVRVP